MGRKLKPQLPRLASNPASIKLDADLIEGFVRNFLWHRFNGPKATPQFHKELWQHFCDPNPFVFDIAPRGHAKSTAVTLSCSLAALLFGWRDFLLIISDTEAQAVDHVRELKIELTENEDLIEAFNVHGLSTDNEAEVVCHVGDRVFKVMGKGAGQKVRGSIWRKRRPDLVIVDDLENDEEVESKVQRDKLLNWFLSSLLPAGADDCLYRIVGTILHNDSLLMGLTTDPHWTGKVYSAHKAFDDFSSILWPEKFSAERLKALRNMYARKHKSSNYCREYLSQVVADEDRYFKPEWFLPMLDDDHRAAKRYYSAIDFAISQKETSDRTAIVTVGVMPDDRIAVVDCRAGRWDAEEIIEQMFEVQERWESEIFIAEAGAIEKAIGPFLRKEMRRRHRYINIETRIPLADKIKRARSLQGPMKAGAFLFDQDAEWYPELFDEMTTFPRGKHDDRVDAFAWLGLLLESLSPSETLEEMAEADVEYDELMSRMDDRRSVTGY